MKKMLLFLLILASASVQALATSRAQIQACIDGCNGNYSCALKCMGEGDLPPLGLD